MFDAADILVDRHPVIGRRPLEGCGCTGRTEAQEIPGRIKKCVQRVGLTLSGSAATRAPDVLPGWVMVKRVSGDFEADILRQCHRQVLLRNRDDAAGFAVDDRDRASPVALARYAPIA